MKKEYERKIVDLLTQLGAIDIQIYKTAKRNHCVKWTLPDGRRPFTFVHTDAHRTYTIKNDLATIRRLSR